MNFIGFITLFLNFIDNLVMLSANKYMLNKMNNTELAC